MPLQNIFSVIFLHYKYSWKTLKNTSMSLTLFLKYKLKVHTNIENFSSNRTTTIFLYTCTLTLVSVFHALHSFQAHGELLDRMTHALEEELLHNDVLQRRRGAGEVRVVRRRALGGY